MTEEALVETPRNDILGLHLVPASNVILGLHLVLASNVIPGLHLVPANNVILANAGIQMDSKDMIQWKILRRAIKYVAWFNSILIFV